MGNQNSSSTSNDLFNHMNHHLIMDDIPSNYLSNVINNPEFKEYPFNLLFQLQLTDQSPIYHPEGNVWNHTLMVVDEAAKRKNQSKHPNVFMWAALLHDIGKPKVTKIKHKKITAYNHDKVGAELAFDFLSNFTNDKIFIDHVCQLILFHMQILYVAKSLPFSDISAMKQQTDINEIALLGLCDRLGRTGASQKEEETNMKEFIRKCKATGRRQ